MLKNINQFRGGIFGCSSIGYQKAPAEFEATSKKHRGEVEAKDFDQKGTAGDRVARFSCCGRSSPSGQSGFGKSGRQGHH